MKSSRMLTSKSRNSLSKLMARPVGTFLDGESLNNKPGGMRWVNVKERRVFRVGGLRLITAEGRRVSVGWTVITANKKRMRALEVAGLITANAKGMRVLKAAGLTRASRRGPVVLDKERMMRVKATRTRVVMGVDDSQD